MKRKNSTVIIIISLIIIGGIITFLLYSFYIDEILNALNLVPELLILTTIVLIKIVLISIMGGFLLYRWYRQEQQYFSDIPFLFSNFFFILIFGKLLDILLYMLYYEIDPLPHLILVKVRYVLIIINIIPVLFLSIQMLLIYLSIYERFKSLKTKQTNNKIQGIILSLIISIAILLIILAPELSSLLTIYPFIMISSFIMIIWMFLYANKSKRLSEINSLIVGIGFIFYLFTTVFRGIGIGFLDRNLSSFLSEIFEIIVFIIIFIGLNKKSKYYRSQ